MWVILKCVRGHAKLLSFHSLTGTCIIIKLISSTLITYSNQRCHPHRRKYDKMAKDGPGGSNSTRSRSSALRKNDKKGGSYYHLTYTSSSISKDVYRDWTLKIAIILKVILILLQLQVSVIEFFVYKGQR